MKKILYIFGYIFLMYSCANPVAPSGGEKDTAAPILLKQVPENGTVSFAEKKIELNFNEYITFENGEDKIIITPQMPEKPRFVVSGKKLIIKLPEDLEEDVTYSITLLNAVKDYREGNVLNISKYVFSTGEFIDSASVSGKVVDSYTNKPITDAYVGLYNPADTGVLKYSKPVYVSPLDDKGVFTIDFVKDGSYVLAAIQDKNLNFVYDQNSERVSLPSTPILITGSKVIEENIELFYNKSRTLVNEYKVLSNNKLYFYFNQEVESISLDCKQFQETDRVYFNANNDTLYYHWTSDTLSNLNFEISLDGQEIDTLNLPVGNIEKNLSTKLKKTVALSRELEITLPLYIIDFSKTMIAVKDSLNKPVSFTARIDKEKLKLKLIKPKLGPVSINIDSGAITYFNSTYNKEIAKLTTLVEETGSLLEVKINTKNTNKKVVELLDGEGNRKKVIYLENEKMISFKNLNPANYYIRIYQDSNENGKWDTGDLDNLIRPEITLLYSQAIEIKQNWDKEITLSF